MNLWTDGSCLGNPGPGGWACYHENLPSRFGGELATTSNQMELRAIYEGMKWAWEMQQDLHLWSDSQWALNMVSGKWKPNKYPHPEEIHEAGRLKQQMLDDGYVVDLQWVRGHDKSVQNSKADTLANQEAHFAARINRE